MVARYDTIIEKKTHAEISNPSSINGLRRVDSEGTTSLAAGSAQSKVHSKGFPFRAISADHIGLPRQGAGSGSNFAELFEMTKNVQETFV